ncbi:MAG: haloacid dehalogenase superfamily protein subfamily variant 3 with third motif having or [Candidatus Saccharibacteria bacterium]|nr:haloacid dehalogenase superfamily protein subfamily variant 3 with third motif having or [Candidatus Saccharibacteria bacterium]
MSEIKVALFDVDGVLVQAARLFSQIYAEKYGLNIEKFEPFFTGDFRLALAGKADLKELILNNRELWQYGEPDQILDLWFEAENHPDYDLVEVIKERQAKGLVAFLATDQEKYRTKFIMTKMFPSIFDGIFASSEIGYRKESSEYWAAVLGRLSLREPGLQPNNIAYFDDSQSNIDAANETGINAHLYKDIEQVKMVLG